MGVTYDAFMSYSHAADGKLAPALQSALHRFARPWNRLRALRIFRDKTNLALNPGLWSSIQAALDESEHFILLASREAAASPWVAREVEHWLQRHPPERIFIVLTGGTLAWDPASGAVDAERTDALPPPLLPAIAQEPLYLDLRWARDDTTLSLRHPGFRDAVAQLAAPLHGRPKDELVGEDIRQYRRTRRLAWSAVSALAVLTTLAAAAAVVAVRQRDIARAQRAEAVRQANVALGRQLAAQSAALLTQSPDQLTLAALLAVEATGRHASFEENQALRTVLSVLPRTVRVYQGAVPMRDRVRSLAFSPDGRHLAAAREDGTTDLVDVVGSTASVALPHDETPGAVVAGPGTGVVWKAPGADAEVTSTAFSPDGRLLATGANDGTARVWEVASGRELLRVAHDSGVSTVAFDSLATHLASGGQDGSLRLWEVATGRPVATWQGAEEVREAAFAPGGRDLAAISTDGRVTLIDVRARRVRRTWYAGAAGLALDFARDGKTLAIAGGNSASVWELTTGRRLLEVTHAISPDEALRPDLWVLDVALSPDGKYLASGGRDATARLWSVATGHEVIRLAHAAPVSAVTLRSDGAMLGTASYDGTARLWEVPSGRELLRTAHPGGAEVVSFSPGGSHLASGGMDGSVRVWELTRGDRVSQMAHPSEVRAVAFSPDGKRLATGTRGGHVRVWSPSGEPRSAAVDLPVHTVDRLLFSEDGSHLAAALGPFLFALDVRDTLPPKGLADSRSANDDVAVSPRFLAAWSREERLLRVWRTSGGGALPPVEVDDLWDLAFDPTGSYLAGRRSRSSRTAPDGKSDGDELIVWSLPERREVGRRPLPRSGTDFKLGPGGRLVALAVYVPDTVQRYSGRHYADVLEVGTAKRIARVPVDENAVIVGFHPDGTRLLTGEGTAVRVWEISSGRLRAQLDHTEDVSAVRLSPEPDVVATLSSGNVTLWNLSTGERLSQLAGPGYVRDVRFSPDGRYLLTGGDDGAAVLWLWKTEDLRRRACERLARNFSPDEWRRFLGTVPYRKTCPNLAGP